uniref:Uncharacterized protein n=1 Tax=Streptomyces avermitilis TaxID=33903 RepID=A0A499VYI2_STRAX|nr:hypothetical protein SAVMC3_74100 [Streptomyces avermitilis]
MHAYDPPRRPSFQPVPAARPAQDLANGSSATPIYDALYAEYVRSFRSLPGDRSGEEDLGFTAFANTPRGTGSYTTGSYGAVGYGARHGTPSTRPGISPRPPSGSRARASTPRGCITSRRRCRPPRAGACDR